MLMRIDSEYRFGTLLEFQFIFSVSNLIKTIFPSHKYHRFMANHLKWVHNNVLLLKRRFFC